MSDDTFGSIGWSFDELYCHLLPHQHFVAHNDIMKYYSTWRDPPLQGVFHSICRESKSERAFVLQFIHRDAALLQCELRST